MHSAKLRLTFTVSFVCPGGDRVIAGGTASKHHKLLKPNEGEINSQAATPVLACRAKILGQLCLSTAQPHRPARVAHAHLSARRHGISMFTKLTSAKHTHLVTES